MTEKRDPNLIAAIEKAGGVVRLAEGLRISSPSVSEWRRVPASRVLEVEDLTGVSRHDLRPDIFGPALSRVGERLKSVLR